MFRSYADLEFHGSSPLYEALARDCAERPELARPLLAAPLTQRRALLYFAAVQYLLGRVPAEPLAGWYRSLGGTRVPDGELAGAFGDFVGRYRDELGVLCAGRTTQTNEAARTALLRPALSRIARTFPNRPVTLIELGTSAGLLLLPDRYGYDYSGRRAGRPDAPEALVMPCELRAEVPDDLDLQPVIADRIGIDLNPIAADDPDATDWLRACVWPEHTDRRARLDAALAEARAVRPRLIAGDLVGALPAVLAGAGLAGAAAAAALPVVFASNALAYLTDPARATLIGLLHETGRRRDLAVVLNEAARCGAALFAEVPVPPGAVSTPTVVTWVGGRPAVEVLGTAAAHGRGLDWRPARYPYAPAL